MAVRCSQTYFEKNEILENVRWGGFCLWGQYQGIKTVVAANLWGRIVGAYGRGILLGSTKKMSHG